MTCTGYAFKDPILSKPGIEDGCDQPSDPKQTRLR